MNLSFTETCPGPADGFYSPADLPHDRFDAGFDHFFVDRLDPRGGHGPPFGRPVLPAGPPAAVAVDIGAVHPEDMPYELEKSATSPFLSLPDLPDRVRAELPERPDAGGTEDGPTFGRPLSARGDGPFLTLLEYFFPNDPRLALGVANYATDLVELGRGREAAWAVSMPTVVPVASGRLRHAGRLVLTAGADLPGEVHVSYEGRRGLLWPNTPGRRRSRGLIVHVQDGLEAVAWERAAAGAASVIAECAPASNPGESLGCRFADRHVRALYGVGQDPATSDAFLMGQIHWFEDAPCGGAVARVVWPGDAARGRDAGLGRPPANRCGARLLIDEPRSVLLQHDWSFEVAVGGPRDRRGTPAECLTELRVHAPDRHPFATLSA